MKYLIFLYSHPIQYFAPLNKALAASGDFDLTVYYCSKRGVEAMRDKGFQVQVQWDVPLLEGYRSIFLPNWRSGGTPEGGFWSLINPGIVRALWQAPKSYVIVHGWGYCTHILAILAGRLFGHRVCIRGESVWRQECLQSCARRRLKKFLFKYLLFPLIDYFLYIGTQNKAFYVKLGVPEHKLVFTPYAVDNGHFQKEYRRLLGQKAILRTALGLPPNARMVLFSGKFVAKKRPADLLEAYRRAGVANTCLVFMGDGPLRGELEAYCREHSLADRVYLTGFVNQSGVSRYYAAADVFVMCSEAGETWGLSVNEAMNFGLPVILSDLTGCSEDLCRPQENGYVFPAGDVEALARLLKKLLTAPLEILDNMGKVSQQIVARYDYERIVKNLASELPDSP